VVNEKLEPLTLSTRDRRLIQYIISKVTYVTLRVEAEGNALKSTKFSTMKIISID
jgi:hypothetical protein